MNESVQRTFEGCRVLVAGGSLKDIECLSSLIGTVYETQRDLFAIAARRG